MRQVRSMLLLAFLVSFGSSAIAQQTPQLTPVPPKPTCTPFLRNGACADLWNTYNQAAAQRQREELQLYVNRQKELASEAATAPLQQQIADLTKLTSDQQSQIGDLQKQMESDAAAALEARQVDAATAHQQGLVEGLEKGVGGTLLLGVLIFGVMRLAKYAFARKSQTASA
jgi:hypothetical protein